MAAAIDRQRQKLTILRQVYETNRGTGAADRRGTGAGASQRQRPGRRWPATAFAALTLVLLLLPVSPRGLISAGDTAAPDTIALTVLPKSAQGIVPWVGPTGAYTDAWRRRLGSLTAEPVGAGAPALVSLVAPMSAPRLAGTGEHAADYALFTDPAVPVAGLLGLGVKTIVIDPGHGGRDPGAVGANGLAEKDVVLDVALRMREYLRAGGRADRVLLTRADDRSLTLRQRVAFANDNDADLFISLHVNALPEPWHAFIETYYFGPPADDASRRLAEKENRDSDYALSDFQQMISRISDTFKQRESARLAERLQRDLFANLSEYDRPLVNRGTRTAPFVVLLASRMPSVLVEITSISNGAEEALLATESYRDEIARHLAEGIAGYISDHEPILAKGVPHGKE